MRTYGHDYYILHDNARVHPAAIVNQYLATNLTGTLLSHPPYSPDLNPVEQLGNLIMSLIQIKQCKTLRTSMKYGL